MFQVSVLTTRLLPVLGNVSIWFLPQIFILEVQNVDGSFMKMEHPHEKFVSPNNCSQI